MVSWFIMQPSKGRKKKAGLYIFKQPISKASVAFTNDILLAFGESVNHMLFHR